MDPYVYPGTNVLKNLREIRDPGLLNEFEAEATSRRLHQLERRPAKGSFDAAHLQAIHRYIFQDLHAWAGEFRTVNISRAGGPFALQPYILPSLHRVFEQLQKENHLRAMSPAAFPLRAGYYLGEINAIHPFRDGNGRAQREFLRQLARHGGHTLHWARVSREEMYEASRLSFERGDSSGLAATIRSALGA